MPPVGRDQPKAIPPSRFADDDGSVEPLVRETLSAEQASPFEVVNVLTRSRLLVPLVAVLDERDTDSAAEKDSHMASVTLLHPDGRRGLLAFTSVSSLSAWDASARGVPVPGLSAAQAAVLEADALIVDVAGPHQHVIDGPGLRAMSEGRRWLPPGDDEDVIENIHAALALLAADGWVNIRLDPSEAADLLVVLELPGGAHPDGRGGQQLAQSAADALGRNAVLRARLIRGLQIAVERP